MNVAFIPVRGGSKSIPLKNIKIINGKPLVYWTIKAACLCNAIDKVYVSTDSLDIKNTVESFKFAKLEVVDRSEETATDTASTESAMLEFAEKHKFQNIVLIQATSPLLKSIDLERGFRLFNEDGVDSVLSVVRKKRFQWRVDDYGYVSPINYDYLNRPRRQDFDGYLIENGAFYINSREGLLASKSRLSGRIKAVEMRPESYWEIDELSDWQMVEFLMKNENSDEYMTAADIKLFLTDCDGCLTDSGMYYSENGDELKKFNTHDGMGFKLLKDRGILTGIITGEDVILNKRRAEKLNVDFYISGCKDKVAEVKRICNKNSISLDNVVYIGDDINDIEVIKSVGWGCAPADAIPQVRKVARIVTEAEGGKGVIREIVDMIIKAFEN